MTKLDTNFLEYIVYDVLLGIDDISYRPMFSSYGIYKDGIIFAIVSNNNIYFKVDETNQAKYEKHHSQPFVYYRKNKKVSLSYWELPLSVLENKEEIKHWVEESCLISKKVNQEPFVDI